jgi:hypothetical protein
LDCLVSNVFNTALDFKSPEDLRGHVIEALMELSEQLEAEKSESALRQALLLSRVLENTFLIAIRAAA